MTGAVAVASKTVFAALVMCALLATTSGVATRIVPVPDSGASPAATLILLFLACLPSTAVLVWALLRSAWSGRKLAATLCLLHFGIAAFMSQNETLYFNAALDVPLAVVGSVLAASLVSAGLFAPFAVWLFGRSSSAPDGAPLGVTRHGRAWKVALLAALVYPALYFLFGYFVVWQLTEARLLYQGSPELLSFADHMAGLARDDPGIFPWQTLRGLLWVGLALPVMHMSRAGWLETAVLVGLLFSLLMSMQLWIPNPYMPQVVRLGHFVETSISNWLFGFATVWALRP